MQYEAKTVDEYLEQIPEDRKPIIETIRKVIKNNLPKGFEEGINYKMIGYYVPHSAYPNGYHGDPKIPLPFINLASQKNSVNLYHMGIYAKKELLDWFVAEYPKHCKTKLDIGKSCICFKKMNDIPYELIGNLVSKMTVDEWISIYKNNIKR